MHIKEFRERKMALIVRRCLRKSAHAAVAVALFTAVFAAAPQFSSYASDKAVETVYLGTPAHVWWVTETTGKWSSVSKAHEYQVKLYIADSVDRDEDNWRKAERSWRRGSYLLWYVQPGSTGCKAVQAG